MPELVPVYERAVALAGGSDLAARCLSGYQPPAFIAGCSQAVFSRPASSPLLIRNYDYSPALWEATIVRSGWSQRRIVGMSDCLLGLLDGINDAGLAASLAFGGRKVVGEGFGMPHILRYVLEVCENTSEAVSVLSRVPSHMAYNVTLLDAQGEFKTLFVSPDRPPFVTNRGVITNHQHGVEWHRHAIATGSVDRLRTLESHLHLPEETEERFIGRFLEPPVFSSKIAAGIGTLYTAAYRPTTKRVSYLWPRHRWDAGVEGPLEGKLSIEYEAG
jgi:predicted choloylglycine hydrolase